MATVEEILNQVDGLRRDAAKRVEERFATVSELASATTEQLTEISGIGAVMADRIHAAAAGTKGGEATAQCQQATPPAGDTTTTAAATPSATTRPVATPSADTSPTGPAATGPSVIPSSTGGDGRGLVGRVVHTATGTARVLVERAVPVARKLVDRVVKRGR